MTGRWKSVPLSLLLRQTRQPVTLENGTEYKQVTVSLHGRGVGLRRRALGEEIRTKRQFVIRTGQLIYSRIDARNGAFGLVPNAF